MVILENVTKKFGDKKIFDNFNLTIKNGEFIAITGASGSGKTTLLNMIGMIEKPSQGDIYIDNFKNPIIDSKNGIEILKNKIGYLFQNFALVDNETVSFNLDIALKYIKCKNKDLLKKEALKKVGLDNFESKKIYTLSGGEQQRVALARLLLKPCDIILADEPTGSLDKKNSNMVMQLLKEINKAGKTVIIVTHDELIWSECDVVVKL